MAAQVPPVTRRGETREDVHARITASNWQRRSWTLQEVVLAKRLWFQFGNMLIEKVFAPIASSTICSLTIPWAYYCDTIDYDWRNDASFDETQRLYRVWCALIGRGISVKEDLTLCVAIQMDLDISQPTQMPSKDRIRKLWTMLKVVRTGLLCYPGEKFEDPAHRRPLCNPGDWPNIGSSASYLAFIKPEGVSVTLHGLRFQLPEQRNP